MFGQVLQRHQPVIGLLGESEHSGNRTCLVALNSIGPKSSEFNLGRGTLSGDWKRLSARISGPDEVPTRRVGLGRRFSLTGTAPRIQSCRYYLIPTVNIHKWTVPANTQECALWRARKMWNTSSARSAEKSSTRANSAIWRSKRRRRSKKKAEPVQP